MASPVSGSRVPRPESTRSSRLFILFVCLAFRWMNACLTRTYDNPDEYWQGPEVAHRLVFGQGYLTWEWTHRIRSFFHPLLFAALYKVLDLCHIHQTNAYVLGPKLLQATISAFGDVATYRLAKKIYGDAIAPFILLVTLSSSFHFLMAARTLSNTLEMALTIIAMSLWPFPGVSSLSDFSGLLTQYQWSLFWASLACVVRPTNALIWLFLGLQLVYHAPSRWRFPVLANALVIVPSLLMANSVLDTYLFEGGRPGWWHSPVFVPWAFLKTNVFQSISVFYGAHPWHWYFSQGVPFMLFTYVPWCVAGAIRSWQQGKRALHGVLAWVMLVYSLLSHKEFRFLYPLFPLLLIFTSHGLACTWRRFAGGAWRPVWLLVLAFSQLALGMYLCLWHQRGVTDVMAWLAHERNQSNVSDLSAGFLMPCHSTPWLSALHARDPVPHLWFLTCEPPLNDKDDAYVDEADAFYDDPLEFVQKWPHPWPNYVVFFEHLENEHPDLIDYLQNEHDYVPLQRFFNTHAHWDSRRQGDVIVYHRVPSMP
ncbi:Alg9-like mannosyltransferase family-domain-containing protein [Gongronella butleri]|nr:Alg9-like mannosyltransferase family-domain-containing protein [Gongronella butleri]